MGCMKTELIQLVVTRQSPVDQWRRVYWESHDGLAQRAGSSALDDTARC